MQENTEIKEIVKKQQEQILELIPKVGNTTNNTINNNKFTNNKIIQSGRDSIIKLFVTINS